MFRGIGGGHLKWADQTLCDTGRFLHTHIQCLKYFLYQCNTFYDILIFSRLYHLCRLRFSKLLERFSSICLDLAPCSNSNSAIACWLYFTAADRGLSPLMSVWFMSTTDLISVLTVDAYYGYGVKGDFFSS